MKKVFLPNNDYCFEHNRLQATWETKVVHNYKLPVTNHIVDLDWYSARFFMSEKDFRKLLNVQDRKEKLKRLNEVVEN